ncbi:interleukin-1 receptor accessory protein-like 1-B, partial [Lates japonicus]
MQLIRRNLMPMLLSTLKTAFLPFWNRAEGREDGGKMRPPSPLLILLYITLSRSVKVVSKRGS